MEKHNGMAYLLSRVKRGELSQQDFDGLGIDDFPLHRDHMAHCFGYLRNLLMCCGDTSVDGNLTEAEAAAGNVWDASGHLCKDYGQLNAWAEEHRPNDHHFL